MLNNSVKKTIEGSNHQQYCILTSYWFQPYLCHHWYDSVRSWIDSTQLNSAEFISGISEGQSERCRYVLVWIIWKRYQQWDEGNILVLKQSSTIHICRNTGHNQVGFGLSRHNRMVQNSFTTSRKFEHYVVATFWSVRI